MSAGGGAAGREKRVRLFVALELPAEVRRTLAGWRPCAAGLRAVRDEDLHVTLCFLGWRFEREIEPILEACSVSLAGCPAASLTVADALWLPPRRPRVLAVRLTDAGGALAAAQARLSRALSAGGWYTPETRPFLAHVTVARVARGGRRPYAMELSPVPELSFDGTGVTVYRSRLSARGARYEALGTVELDVKGVSRG